MYKLLCQEYITRAKFFREQAVQEKVWWKPRVRKHYINLLKMADFYLNNAYMYDGRQL